MSDAEVCRDMLSLSYLGNPRVALLNSPIDLTYCRAFTDSAGCAGV
jgi:hypothetical protein